MLRIIILYCILIITFGYKSISITPGGLKGFYVLGICKYIKENYCLDDYNFYGSSAGAWNALYLSSQFNDAYYFDKIITIKQEDFVNLFKLENDLKDIILKDKNIEKDKRYSIQALTEKCNICFSAYKGYKFEKVIKNDFDNWEDFLECCIASSHLPIISNREFFYTYQNHKCVDGGLFHTNYPNHIEPCLIISPKMFKNKQISKYSKSTNLNIERLIYEGYRDAIHNCDYFNSRLKLL
tara:strand:+ start:686 stop:1402 length:717 start_codon:yes stop_codon:yes gene_type:complete